MFGFYVLQVVGWVEPPGPAFGRPDDKLRDTHRFSLLESPQRDGFRKRLYPSCELRH